MLRVIVYDKLDSKGRAIPGERRAMAAFSDEDAQQAYIEDAKFERERIKFDYFKDNKFDLPESAQPNDICYALYKKWTKAGHFELSGYSYTKNFEDSGAGFDQFVMPVLINKSHSEAQAWKDAAIRSRLGSGKEYRKAKKALERLPVLEREKREAEFLVDFAQNAYQVFKPKTKRERKAVQVFAILAIIWLPMILFFIPEEPNAAQNARSVSWLPGASDISYFSSPELLVFECTVPWSRAQSYVDADFTPARNKVFTRYSVYYPNANPTEYNDLEMTAAEYEEWQSRFNATVKSGYEVTLPDGSTFLYDSAKGILYGMVQGETRDDF